ncbi:MAG: PhzF family phenazine biosynthesis protein [Terriglobales bacterium]
MSPTARRYPFVQMDVFTARPLEGNQLAVFPDARGLSDDQMQALAREKNLSETTFILPRDDATERQRGHRVRIFTTQEELPFAGHPTLGTATVLHAAGGADLIELDLNVGKIPVRFTTGSDGLVFGEMQQRDPEFGPRHSREDVARAAGLNVEDIASDLPIETVSTGLAFTIVPIRTLATTRRLRPDLQRAAEYLERSGGKFFYFVSRETEDCAARLHARMFFYNGEDPATGSAAGCTAAWMVAHGVAAPEESAVIEQGIEIHRPSRIVVCAGRQGDRIVTVRVGGNSVEVIRGEVFL